LENAEVITVEVAFALPEEQTIVPLEVAGGTTVEQAIKLSGLLEKYPQIDVNVQKVGVFGKLTKLSQPLRDGDRVEIYRALLADPKEVRRQRAAEGKVTKRGAGHATAEASEQGS
jgi:putative ubiquitin-RnfH superfamily antitoxin RatB of RatAB toxin-antitoxin module